MKILGTISFILIISSGHGLSHAHETPIGRDRFTHREQLRHHMDSLGRRSTDLGEARVLLAEFANIPARCRTFGDAEKVQDEIAKQANEVVKTYRESLGRLLSEEEVQVLFYRMDWLEAQIQLQNDVLLECASYLRIGKESLTFFNEIGAFQEPYGTAEQMATREEVTQKIDEILASLDASVNFNADIHREMTVGTIGKRREELIIEIDMAINYGLAAEAQEALLQAGLTQAVAERWIQEIFPRVLLALEQLRFAYFWEQYEIRDLLMVEFELVVSEARDYLAEMEEIATEDFAHAFDGLVRMTRVGAIFLDQIEREAQTLSGVGESISVEEFRSRTTRRQQVILEDFGEVLTPYDRRWVEKGFPSSEAEGEGITEDPLASRLEIFLFRLRLKRLEMKYRRMT